MTFPGDDDERWIEHAACAGLDTALFYPQRGESTREAKAVCAACPVKQECLDYALRTHEKFGIFGGLSERQRRRIRTPMWYRDDRVDRTSNVIPIRRGRP